MKWGRLWAKAKEAGYALSEENYLSEHFNYHKKLVLKTFRGKIRTITITILNH